MDRTLVASVRVLANLGFLLDGDRLQHRCTTALKVEG